MNIDTESRTKSFWHSHTHLYPVLFILMEMNIAELQSYTMFQILDFFFSLQVQRLLSNGVKNLLSLCYIIYYVK